MSGGGSWRPTGSTRTAAVIGDPVRHSLSPALHNAAFAHLGLDWVYVALPVPGDRGEEAVEAMRVLGIDGLSVTMPHKQAVARTVDELTPAAARLGAVNCVQRVDDRLVGHNTDGIGFLRSVEQQLGFRAAGSAVVVLGAGGAAVSVGAALAEAGAEVGFLNRSADRAEAAVAAVGERARVASPAEVGDATLVVQATPLGMNEGDPLPIDPDLLAEGCLFAELIYHPAETSLLAEARRRGLRSVNGVGMLLYQAGEQFTLWTAETAPIEVMAAAVGLSL
jgi:shikimate dehydrogenase